MLAEFRAARETDVKSFTLRDPIRAWLADAPFDPEARSIADPYRSAVYTYTGIQGIARAVTAVQLQFRKAGSDELVPQSDQVASWRLLRKPNAAESREAFWMRTIALRYKCGEVFWIWRRPQPGTTLPSLHCVAPQRMRPLHAGGVVVAWRHTPRYGTEETLPLEDVLRIYFASPEDEDECFAPVRAAQLAIDAHTFASRFNVHVFLNHAEAGTTYATDKPLSREQRAELEDMIRQRYAGYWNARRPMVMWGGLKKEDTAQTMRDLEYQEGKDQARNEQLAALMVPPLYAGILDDASLNNTREQKLVFWELAGKPELTHLVECWNLFVQPRVDAGLYLDPLWTSVPALQEQLIDFTDKVLALQKYQLPLNQLIEAFDLPFEAQPHGDTVLVPAGQIPIDVLLADAEASLAAAREPEPRSDAEPEEPEAQRAFHEALKGVQATLECREKDARQRRLVERFRASYRGLVQVTRLRLRTFLLRQRDEVIRRMASEARSASKAPSSGMSTAPSPQPTAKGPEWIARILFDVRPENQRLAALATTFLREGLGLGGTQAGTEAGTSGEWRFDLDAPGVRRRLQQQAIRVRRINATTREMLRRTLTQGLDKGETLTELTERVAKTMNHRASAQAFRIAETEIHEAVAAGRHEGFQQAGVRGKSWLTSGRGVEPDGPTRESHWNAEQATRDNPIPANAEFELINPHTGLVSACQYPGQGDLPPGERINCSCVQLARQMREGRSIGLAEYEERGFVSYEAYKTGRKAGSTMAG